MIDTVHSEKFLKNTSFTKLLKRYSSKVEVDIKEVDTKIYIIYIFGCSKYGYAIRVNVIAKTTVIARMPV